jgi:hypothetical protein
MDRLRKQHGIEPPTDSAGNVPLQMGGSVSKEAYQKALESLNNSPITR